MFKKVTRDTELIETQNDTPRSGKVLGIKVKSTLFCYAKL